MVHGTVLTFTRRSSAFPFEVVWNFIEGVQPPKRKLSGDDKVASKRRYDACERKREFQPHWLKQFSWLEYKSSSAGAGAAAHAGVAVGGAAGRRDDDSVVDVEGTAKNT